MAVYILTLELRIEYLARKILQLIIKTYFESKDPLKSVALSASGHIYNAQTKGMQHKSKRSICPEKNVNRFRTNYHFFPS